MNDNSPSWKTIFWMILIAIVFGLAVGKYLAVMYIPPGSEWTEIAE
jgi:hypothetical protein